MTIFIDTLENTNQQYQYIIIQSEIKQLSNDKVWTWIEKQNN